MSEPSLEQLEAIYWKILYLSLPSEGVNTRFPTEQSRKNRIDEVRWRGKPSCLKCGHSDPLWIGAREVFQCRSRDCRHQFSKLSGTVMHRSRIELRSWFGASEMVIQHNFNPDHAYREATSHLKFEFALKHTALFRLKRLVREDIRRGGEGFLKSAVCVRLDDRPSVIKPYTLDHLNWLRSTLSRAD